ncbi:MAG TPA: SprT family zinc-dependent metalloprotease [Candidatus Limnocylindria bacterium]|nr:SprT family zinc-dependent metalloprotease [Candidatus Limnocylindria bacterium]
MSGEPAGRGYHVRRSERARRARLTIDEQGQAVVVLPLRASPAVAVELVTRHAGWIERHRLRLDGERQALAGRPPLEAGRQLRLGGMPHRVEVQRGTGPQRRSTVSLDHAGPEAWLRVRIAALDDRPPAAVVEAWLRRRAQAILAQRVAALGSEIGVRPTGLAVRDQRSRWGSASSRGVLSFSWRLVLCPPWVLDYVVVHELAHLRVSGHGPAFWRLVERHVPDARATQARRWLRDNRVLLRRALD